MHYKKRKKKHNSLVNNEVKMDSIKNIGSRRLIRNQISSKLSRQGQDQPVSDSLKFGSININGLDLENCDEMEKLIAEKDLDVG